MTKEELLQVINEKIEGQYNQLDLSNVVPAILRDLVGASIGVEVEDITDIDGAVLDALSCGDKVIKVTGKQKHAYIVRGCWRGYLSDLCGCSRHGDRQL